MEELIEQARVLAAEFVKSGQDLFIVTVEIEGKMIAVTLKYSKKDKKENKNTNQPLTKKGCICDTIEQGEPERAGRNLRPEL